MSQRCMRRLRLAILLCVALAGGIAWKAPLGETPPWDY